MERKRKVSSHRDVKEHLTCAVCIGIYHDPRNLSCGHVFCKNCLDNVRESPLGRQSYTVISCPTCRYDTTLPVDGVNGLSRNIPIAGLVDQDISDEPGPSRKRSKGNSTCSEHSQEPRVIYCINCLVLICVKCYQENHFDHEITTSNECLGELSQKIEDAKQQYQVQLTTLENNLLEADQKEKNMFSALHKKKQDCKAKLAKLSTDTKKGKAEFATFREMGQQFKNSLAIAIPKLKSKTLLEDLDDEDFKSYVENVENVTNLLQTDIGEGSLKVWNKHVKVSSAASRPQPGSIPSTSG